MSATLRSLGLATPALRWSQQRIADTMIEAWGLGDGAAGRFRRLADACAIDARHAVMPLTEIVSMSTAARMEAYEEHAAPLAFDAATRALRGASLEPRQVTDLIIVSCTGFSAPGLDVALVRQLGLSTRVQRTTIGFMGCFGAVIGLRSAMDKCTADPRAVTLVVCLELCSLHLRDEVDMQNQVASALFADGAAAAVVVGESARRVLGDAEAEGRAAGGDIGCLVRARSLLLPDGENWMSWRVTDHGFRMTLSRDVPGALRTQLRSFVPPGDETRTFVVHPGGPEILDAANEALELGDARGIEISRAVLRRFGNMSSATVLFVLDEALRAGHELPALLMAFGPGLSIESIALEPRRTR
ncbi:MAG: type III polyketide synthase [Planctomycetota bacterium]